LLQSNDPTLARAKRPPFSLLGHLTGDGPTIFDHVCRLGLEGIVSKRTDGPYRSGPSKTWLKSKNPASEAARPEREDDQPTPFAAIEVAKKEPAAQRWSATA
jgi:bifunctional non-homologous end joining protein LigD